MRLRDGLVTKLLVVGIFILIPYFACAQYDFLHKFLLIDNLDKSPEYYNGCHIKFIPKKNDGTTYTYDFYTPLPQILKIDTVATKYNRKEIRRDAKVLIDTIYTDRYKPHLIETDIGPIGGTICTDIIGSIFKIDSSWVDLNHWIEVLDLDGYPMRFCVEDVSKLFFIEIGEYYNNIAEKYQNLFVGRYFYAQDVKSSYNGSRPITYAARSLNKDFSRRLHDASAIFAGAVGKMQCIGVDIIDGIPFLILEANGNIFMVDDNIYQFQLYNSPASALLEYKPKADRLLMVQDLVPAEEWELRLSQKISDEVAKEVERELINEQKKIDLIQRFGIHFGESIFNRDVTIGMTQEMCIESWGWPIDIVNYIHSEDEIEQWIYSNYKYLHFKDGLLFFIVK